MMVVPAAREQGLMPHQEEATAFLLRRNIPHQGALLAMKPRLGKTVAAVEAAHRTGKGRILVVSPLTILDGWTEEIRKWWRGDSVPLRICHGKLPDGIDGWTLTNYETLRQRAVLVTKKGAPQPRYRIDWPSGYDLIVLDESVKIKSHSAIITRVIFSLIDANPGACSWLLSGNPAPKDLSDLWSQLWIADPATAGNSYWRFAATYCVIQETQWGPKVVGNQPGAEERLKADFRHSLWAPANAPELTPVRHRIEEVPLTGEQLRVYREMEVHFRAVLDQLSGHELLAPNVMVQLVRLLQLASNPAIVGGPYDGAKWRRLAALIREQRVPLPLIVWTSFKETVRLLSIDIPLLFPRLRVATLTGDTTPAERTRVRQRFQSGQIDVLLAHPGVGRFGLNLSAARGVVWLEKSWEADSFYQAGFRARHLEQPEPLEVVELLATANGQATIDHAVHRLLQRRVGSTGRLTAGGLRQAWQR